jgi:hypothetical protein
MNIVHKVTDNAVSDTSAANGDGWIEAFIEAGAETLAEVRCDWSREKEVIRGQSRDLTVELEVRIARLEGQVDGLLALLQGKGKAIDLPALPKIEASAERTLVTKVKVTQ